jgi:hypothetical protein
MGMAYNSSKVARHTSQAVSQKEKKLKAVDTRSERLRLSPKRRYPKPWKSNRKSALQTGTRGNLELKRGKTSLRRNSARLMEKTTIVSLRKNLFKKTRRKSR